MQTESDAQRLASLGVDPEKIKVTGNMKFDQLAASSSASQRSRLGLNADERLIVAGSTHPKEEDLILKSYKELLMQLPSAKLLIAPRHPSRSKEVSGIISSYGFSPVRISQLSSQCMPCLNKPVFLLDTVGELVSFYSSADAVFVGGSLVRKGGHNILEPASAGKPVIFGQHMFNFRDIAKMFLDNDAAIMVRDQEELTAAISGLLKNTSLVARLVTNAKEIIINNQGATSKNIEAIKSVYKYK
jgi:3-deoxy-D-manno-octulosonic-acid transferase